MGTSKDISGSEHPPTVTETEIPINIQPGNSNQPQQQNIVSNSNQPTDKKPLVKSSLKAMLASLPSGLAASDLHSFALGPVTSRNSELVDSSSSETPFEDRQFSSVDEKKVQNILLAYLAFKQPSKRRRDFLLPKDRAAWLEYLVQLAKRKTEVEYLSNKELRKVIIRARPNLAWKKYIYADDPDAPICLKWNEHQVAKWIGEIGFPQLKEAFILNFINGRRLINIDVCALRKMGLKHFDEMKEVASKIRELLGLHSPNILRAIMRKVPNELYLRERVFNGRTYDLLTFKSFCEQNGFDYLALRGNKNAVISCTVEVLVVPSGVLDEDSEADYFGSDVDDMSLENAPSVEFIVRNCIIRNQTVHMIIESILESVFSTPESKRDRTITDNMKNSLKWAFNELGLDEELNAQQRLNFATIVAGELLEEMNKTAIVLGDIEELQKHIMEDIAPEKVNQLRNVAEQFMEEVMPIAALMAFGELDMESIFKQEPTFGEFINDVIQDAEKKTNTLVPDTKEFVDGVIKIAQLRIDSMELPGLPLDMVSSAKSLINKLLNEMIEGTFVKTSASVDHLGSVSNLQMNNPLSLGYIRAKSEMDSRAKIEPEAGATVSAPELSTKNDNIEGKNNDNKSDDIMQDDKSGKMRDDESGKMRDDKSANRKQDDKSSKIKDGESKDKNRDDKSDNNIKDDHGEDKKDATLSQKLIEGLDQEVIVGHAEMQKHVSGSDKPRKKRSELTVSRSSSRGSSRTGHHNPLVHSKGLRKVESDIAQVSADFQKQSSANLSPSKVEIRPQSGNVNEKYLLLKNGKIINEKGELIGYPGKGNTIMASDGKPLGQVKKNGNAYTREGNFIGKFIVNKHPEKKEPGQNKLGTPPPLQTILDQANASSLVNEKGDVIGKITPDGKIMEEGKLIGTMHANGVILQDDGRPLNINGHIEAGDRTVVANISGGVVKLKIGTKKEKRESIPEQIISIGAKTVIGTTGQRIGDIKQDGKIVARNGKILGTVRPNGAIDQPNGKLANNIQGQIVQASGAVVGKVEQGIIKLPSNPEVLVDIPEGHKILEKVMEEVVYIIGNHEEKIEMRGNGQLVDKDQKSLGQLQDNGLILTAEGKILNIEGDIVTKDGKIIARIGEGLASIVTEGPTMIQPVGKKKMTPTNAENVWDMVSNGEANRIVDENGDTIGLIKEKGVLIRNSGTVIGKIQANGRITLSNGNPLRIKGFMVKEHGQVVGNFDKNGIINMTKEQDRVIIGKLFPDGSISTNDGIYIGAVKHDRRIYAPNGAIIGYVNESWELYGPDGIPFAFVTPELFIVKYDVVTPSTWKKSETPTLTSNRNNKSDTILLSTPINTLKARLEEKSANPPRPVSVPISAAEIARVTAEQDAAAEIELVAAEQKAEANKQIADSRLKLVLEAKVEEERIIEERRKEWERKKKEDEIRAKEERKANAIKKTMESQQKAPITSTTRDIWNEIETQRKQYENNVTADIELTKTASFSSQGSGELEVSEAKSDNRRRPAAVQIDVAAFKGRMKRRKKIVEDWALELEDNAMAEKRTNSVKKPHNQEKIDENKLMRVAADEIVSEIVQLAITRMLLAAEAGKNTDKMIAALKKIEFHSDIDDPRAVAMHLPSKTTATSVPGGQGKAKAVVTKEKESKKNRRISKENEEVTRL